MSAIAFSALPQQIWQPVSPRKPAPIVACVFAVVAIHWPVPLGQSLRRWLKVIPAKIFNHDGVVRNVRPGISTDSPARKIISWPLTLVCQTPLTHPCPRDLRLRRNSSRPDGRTGF